MYSRMADDATSHMLDTMYEQVMFFELRNKNSYPLKNKNGIKHL